MAAHRGTLITGAFEVQILIAIVFAILIDPRRESIKIGMRIAIRMKTE
jgi:hypothetical protein